MTNQPSALLGLQRTNLRQQAVDALRRAITIGELPPGTHVSEVDTAEQLGIGRGTLREAMRQLQQEGLLTEGPRGRLHVRHMDESELMNVFAVRGALEALAARQLTNMPDRADAIQTLHRVLDDMEALKEESLDERVEADLLFHLTLCRASQNSTLVRTWESLEGAIRMSIMYSGMEKAVRNMIVERHRDLVDAIERGDPEVASAAVFEHMNDAAMTLVS